MPARWFIEAIRKVMVEGLGMGSIWKDMLIRGGGPELNEKIMRIILEKRQVTGSTGTIQLQEGRMRFYPKGSEKATVNRTVIYEQK